MNAQFGTDGIRGVANRELTPEFALRFGRALAEIVEPGPVLIGRDTRVSGDMFEGALTAGLTSAGRRVTLAGILPTPALAMLTRVTPTVLGIMISASHNPIEDNGFKCFDRDGFKLGDDLESRITQAFTSHDTSARPTHAEILPVHHDGTLGRRYVDTLVAGGTSLAGLRVVVDAAYGAAYECATIALRALGAEVVEMHAQPDGTRINVNCGATDLSPLASAVRHLAQEGKSAIGVAFDGDADRARFVDELGRPVDGDAVLLALASDLHDRKMLMHATVVGTVMSNFAFERALNARGITLLRTAVGDRYILERLRSEGMVFGGEPSGHVIDLRGNTTGDGPATAIALFALLLRRQESLTHIADSYTPSPQLLINIRTEARDAVDAHPSVREAVAQAEQRLGKEGRILIRPSGTEPLVRVMVEGGDGAMVREIAEHLAQTVRSVATTTAAV